MISPSILRKSLTAGCMALLFALPAHAELTRCSDSAGNVTYLDGACPTEAQPQLNDPVSAAEPAPARSNPRSIDAIALRESPWARTPTSIKAVATDAATLRKAREIMHTDDNLRVSTYQKKPRRSVLN